MELDYIKIKTERNTMRLRQLWQNNKLVGLKLDRSSQDFIKLDEQLVKLFIEHVNEGIQNDNRTAM